jgi:AcrR family transcriptional regulator
MTTDTYHHGHLRAASLDAAIEMIDTDGPDAVTIRGVARRTGVSHTAPLHHFRDRDELLAGVAERGFEQLLERADRSVSGSAADPLSRLRAYGLAYIEHAIEHPGLFRLMFSNMDCPTGEVAHVRLVELVAACQAEGTLAGSDADRTSLLLWAAVHGLAGLHAGGILTPTLDPSRPHEAPAPAVAALDDLLAALAPRT